MHLAFELFVAMAKVKIQHVPYRGSPQAITDLLGKRIDFQVDTPAALMPLIRDGRLRADRDHRAEARSSCCPDAPTIGDTACQGYAVTSWLGVAGPAGLPADFVSKVNAELKAILAEPAVIERLRELGSDARADHARGFKAARRRRRREMDQGGRRRQYPEGVSRPKSAAQPRAIVAVRAATRRAWSHPYSRCSNSRIRSRGALTPGVLQLPPQNEGWRSADPLPRPPRVTQGLPKLLNYLNFCHTLPLSPYSSRDTRPKTGIRRGSRMARAWNKLSAISCAA